jgi:type IV secretory pathway TraG/TraD family ATPase VirD4
MQLPESEVLIIVPQLPPIRARKLDTRDEVVLAALCAAPAQISAGAEP